MRNINHLLCESRTGKTISVWGWRKELALKFLSFDSKKWNYDVARMYVGLQVLKYARDKHKAINFIHILKSLSDIEVRLWSGKFLSNKRTKKCWRTFDA